MLLKCANPLSNYFKDGIVLRSEISHFPNTQHLQCQGSRDLCAAVVSQTHPTSFRLNKGNVT